MANHRRFDGFSEDIFMGTGTGEAYRYQGTSGGCPFLENVTFRLVIWRV
jgi:hypothetical protein